MSVETIRGPGARSEVLTFLIADVRGYTSFTQAHGDEAAARLAATFADVARQGVEAHGGRVLELRGDEALAVFTSAREALRAAVALQLVFADEVGLHPELPLRVGIGLDAGEAVPVEGGYRGGALNLAARLCGKAGAGEVLASQGVLHLARAVEGIAFHDHGEFEMKGLDEPVRVSRVSPIDLAPDGLAALFEPDRAASARQPTPSEVPRALDTVTPIVGREHELRRLGWAWRQARRGESERLFLVGPTGIGKTRLAAELAVTAARDGAVISYTSFRGSAGAASTSASRDGAALIVLDDLEAGGDEVFERLSALEGSEPGNALVVAALDDLAAPAELLSYVHRAGDAALLRPAPLGLDEIRRVAALYLGEAAEALPASVLEATGGVPRRVHEQVSEWAHTEASRRLGEAASRAAVGRSDLRSVEAELAGNVVDLQLVRERARLYEAGAGRAAPEPTESPYKGLASFDVDDADRFFGRERLVAELIARLAGASLLGVVGPSGSGKSSAVRAGLIPALRSGVLPGSERWIVALLRPGEHPLRELDRSLWAALPHSLRGRLAGADLPLRAVRDALEGDERILVVVDQFEEVFTSCRDEAQRTAFVSALTEAAGDRRGRAIVLLAVRADFYGRCSEDPALAQMLGANHVLVGSMSADEYRRAIEQPALRVGVHVEPSLTEALVAEVVGESGGLPLLSTALLELWDRRDGRAIRLDAYIQTGGVRGAVARLAEEAYAGLTEEQQAIARSVMLRLAGPGERDAVVRRRVPLAEFDAESNEDIGRVLAVLTERRLVTVFEGTVEVAHEALLREWPRLQDWLEEDRAGRRLHAHLIDTVRGWAESGREQGELYRGARLASALDWTTEHTLELNELERDFLNASREANEREVERQRRTNRRLRGLLAGVAVFLVLALVAGALALVQRGKAEESATQATAQRLGAQAVVEDELDLSLLLARQGFEIDDSEDTRSTLLASLLKAPGAIGVLPGTGDRVLLIRESADGSVLATTDNIGGVAIYDAEALELDRIVRFDGQYFFDISPDGRTLAGSTFEGGPVLALVDIASGQIDRIPLPEGSDFAAFGLPVAFHPDGTHFVTLECRPCEPGTPPMLVRRDPADGAELDARPLPPLALEIERIFYSPDGSRLMLTGFGPEGNRIAVLDAETLEAERVVDSVGFAADLSPDGRTVAVGRLDGTVALIDVATGEEEELQGRHNAMVSGVGFSPDGSTLLSTGDDRDVIVWDVQTRTLREILHGHAGRAFGPAFDGDGSTAFTVSLDGKVIAWDLSGERRLGRGYGFADASLFEGEFDLVSDFSADGGIVAFSTAEGHVVIEDVGAGQPTWEADPWSEDRFGELLERDPAFAPFLGELVTALSFSRDGRLLGVSGENPEVVVYDTATGEEVRRWIASEISWVNSLSFAPDGTVVTANDDGRAALWEPETGELREEFRITPFEPDAEKFNGAVSHAVASPDGSRLAVATYRFDGPGELMVLDVASGDRLWDGRDSDLFNTIVAWSPDSRVVATGGWQSGELALWDAETGDRLLEPVSASAGFVLSVEYAPDGSLIVTGGTDGTVRLWDASTLKQIGSNLPHPDNVWVLAHVMPRDEMLALSMTGRAWRWDLDPARWAEQACLVANRNLTEPEWEAFLPDRDYAPACPE